MQRATKEEAITILEKLRIDYQLVDHPPLWSMDDPHAPKGLPKVKNLLIKKKKSELYYLLLTTNRPVDFKKLATQLNTSRSKLRFATEIELEETLHVISGIVTPLALPNDCEYKIRVLLDADLKNLSAISAHPNVNTATVIISYEDLIKILKNIGYEPTIINFD
ncbi:MAG: YbaK/EbsC family protein [Liquorilactobacillus hordei]|uniref:YbaK/EbsC family protein n=1 Tax=Liquorilactobacillus hordei TaxID=468911 RepID=UPI0039E95E58